MDLTVTILPVVTKDRLISHRFTLYGFSNLTTRQPTVNFTYSRSHAFRYGRKNTKSYFSKNQTHDFRTTTSRYCMQITY